MEQSFVLRSGDRKMLSKIVFALSISLVRSMVSSAMEMLRHKSSPPELISSRTHRVPMYFWQHHELKAENWDCLFKYDQNGRLESSGELRAAGGPNDHHVK
jgi:hypothetical protein